MANYVDKDELIQDIIEYREMVASAKAEGKEKPNPPDKLLKKLILMVNGMAKRPNFSGYSYLDEMKSRAIFCCFRKADYYDPSISPNPFGYYSRIIWQEFVNVIREEEDESYVKAMAFYNSDATYEMLDKDQDVDLGAEGFSVPYFDVEDFQRKRGIKNTLSPRGRKKKNSNPGPLSEILE